MASQLSWLYLCQGHPRLKGPWVELSLRLIMTIELYKSWDKKWYLVYKRHHGQCVVLTICAFSGDLVDVRLHPSTDFKMKCAFNNVDQLALRLAIIYCLFIMLLLIVYTILVSTGLLHALRSTSSTTSAKSPKNAQMVRTTHRPWCLL